MRFRYFGQDSGSGIFAKEWFWDALSDVLRVGLASALRIETIGSKYPPRHCGFNHHEHDLVDCCPWHLCACSGMEPVPWPRRPGRCHGIDSGYFVEQRLQRGVAPACSLKGMVFAHCSSRARVADQRHCRWEEAEFGEGGPEDRKNCWRFSAA